MHGSGLLSRYHRSRPLGFFPSFIFPDVRSDGSRTVDRAPCPCPLSQRGPPNMSSSQTQARDEIAHQIATNIAPEFAGIFSPETIERCAGKFYAALAERARITDYLPVLTEHSVRVHLRPAAHARGFMIDGVPEVLFVCTPSLGRGQMAAALLER